MLIIKIKEISILFFLFLFVFVACGFAQNPNNDPNNAAQQLLDPDDHVLVLIDHEGQMAFAVESTPIDILRNNTGMVAASAKTFEVPTVVTTVAERSFSGPVFPEIREYFPDEGSYIDRTTMNSWEDKRVVKAVKQTGKKKIVFAGLWTEVCINTAALSALEDGYQVYVITDASGGISKEAHDMSIERMIQAGVIPITALQYLLEMHRDWARIGKYEAVNNIAKRYGGGYGLGIDYIKTMKKWQEEEKMKVK